MKREELQKIIGDNGVIASKQDQDRLIARFREAGLDLADFYQDVEMSSYYVDTHQDTSFGGGVIHLHDHSFYELICVRSALGVEYMIDTQCVHIQPGDIIWLSPGVPHRPLMPETMPVPYVRDVLWLSKEFVEVMFQQLSAPPVLNGKGFLLRTAGTQWESLAELFHKGVQESEGQNPYWELVVMGNTMALMAELRRMWISQKPLPRLDREPRLLEKLLRYIDGHYQEKLTLSDVAAHCFVSESTICHTFREKMGISFYRCLTQRRLIESKSMIREGHGLEHVSKAVGFTDYAAFYRAFKREYGISPRQFRELSQSETMK